MVTGLSCLVLTIEYEGQSQKFEFVLDCIDVGMLVCSLGLIAISVRLETKFRGKLEPETVADIAIIGACVAGIIYEAAIAESLY